MARKATSTPIGRKTRRLSAAPMIAEEPIADAPRRGRKPRLQETAKATTSPTDQFMPDGDEAQDAATTALEGPPAKPGRGRKSTGQTAAVSAALGPEPVEPASDVELPAKARRARQLKEVPASAPAEEPIAEDAKTEHADPIPDAGPPTKARGGLKPKDQPAPDTPTGGDDEAAAIVAELQQAEPGSPAATHGSAAHWDPATGHVTFDWPAIERVAAQDGANQPMAKLLLAARADGAKSRWPF